MIRVKVQSTSELKQVARRLETASQGQVRDRAARGIAVTARPVKTRIQAAVRAVEVGSTKGGVARPDSSTNLRGRVAAATDVAATTGGAVFFVAGYRLGVNGSRLAQYLDTEDLPRWRHPVFGRRSAPWQTQTGQPYFYVTIRAAEPQFAGAVEQACAGIAEEICR